MIAPMNDTKRVGGQKIAPAVNGNKEKEVDVRHFPPPMQMQRKHLRLPTKVTTNQDAPGPVYKNPTHHHQEKWQPSLTEAMSLSS